MHACFSINAVLKINDEITNTAGNKVTSYQLQLYYKTRTLYDLYDIYIKCNFTLCLYLYCFVTLVSITIVSYNY